MKMNKTDSLKYVLFLSGLCPSKTSAGKLLKLYLARKSKTSSSMSSSTSADTSDCAENIILQVIKTDEFIESSGSMTSFFDHLKEYETKVLKMLEKEKLLDNYYYDIKNNHNDGLR